MKFLINAFHKLDDWLIDRVAQPIVDRIGKHPIDLAEPLSIGSSVMTAFGFALDLDASLASCVFFSLGIVLQGFVLLSARRTFLAMRQVIRPGFANPFRPVFVLNRASQTCFVVTVFFSLLGIGGTGSPSTMLIVLGLVLSAMSSFFQACTIPAAKVVKQTQFHAVPDAA